MQMTWIEMWMLLFALCGVALAVWPEPRRVPWRQPAGSSPATARCDLSAPALCGMVRAARVLFQMGFDFP